MAARNPSTKRDNGLRRNRRRAVVLGTVLLAAPGLAGAAGQATHSMVVSANPSDVTPFVLNGRVEAVEQIGNRVYVGGTFTQQKNWQGAAPIQTRQYLFAYNATTGQIDAGFNPVIGAPAITLKADPNGSGLFVGGSFATVNGVARTGLVKLDPATGATIAAFKGNTGGGGGVMDMDIAGNKIYVVGTFSKARSVARTRLAAMDTTTGALDTDMQLALTGYNTAVTGAYMPEYHMDISNDGSRMMLVGNFSLVGGTPRTQVAQIDLTTSPDSVTAWSTNRYPFQTGANLKTYVNSVAIDPTGTFMAIAAGCCPVWDGATGRFSQLGDHVARFEMASTGSPMEPTWWSSSPVDTYTNVVISGTAVYVGGHFRWVNARTYWLNQGAVYRKGLAALDPDNGVPFNWNPGRDRGWGVLDARLTAGEYIIGHDTKNVGGEYHPRLAAFPLGVTPPAVVQPALPTKLYALAGTGSTVTTRAFDGTTLGAPTTSPTGDWSWVRGTFTNADNLYAASSDGKLYRLTYDGTSWSNPVDVSTRTDFVQGLAVSYSEMNSMAFVTKGILYNRTGDGNLYWSGFNLESNLTGGFEFTVSGPSAGDGNNWSSVTSMVVIGSQLYYASTDGALRSLAMNGRTPASQSTAAVLSAPWVDGIDWSGVELAARS